MKLQCGERSEQMPEFLNREERLIRLLAAYLASGLFFMLVPGTLVGVANLFAIAGEQTSSAAPASWVDAHGHAQLFGWVGTFILGIGYYNVPNLRKLADRHFLGGWSILLLWIAGVSVHWISAMWSVSPDILMPLSAVLELLAAAVYFVLLAQGYKAQASSGRRMDVSSAVIAAGALGLTYSLALSLWLAVVNAGMLADHQRILVSTTCVWGFVVPTAIGFSSKWLYAVVATQPPQKTVLALAVGGIVCGALIGSAAGAVMILASTIGVLVALNLFTRTSGQPKIAGVHHTFPYFVRAAYVWLLIAAALNVVASVYPAVSGIAGASRHAITVGFMSTLIMAVGSRMLPAFLGRPALYSTKLMFYGLLAITVGCVMRVVGQSLSYSGLVSSAWYVLPVSALIEMSGFLLFVINVVCTLRSPSFIASRRSAQ